MDTRWIVGIFVSALTALTLSGCANFSGDSRMANGTTCHSETHGFLFWAHADTNCYSPKGDRVLSSSADSQL